MSNLGVEFRVGLFTLLGIAVLIFAVFVLSPDLFDTEDKETYYTTLNDASGILPKTHVKTNGVIIGKVASVELLLNSTKVTMEIDAAVKIPVGSTAEVRTVGFLGDKFIEIQRTAQQGFIAPGSEIPRSTSGMELNDLVAIAGSIAKDVKAITENLSDVLGGEEGNKSLHDIVGNIRDFTSDAKGILEENRRDVRAIVENMEKFSTSLNEVLDSDTKEKIDRIIASLDRSMGEVEGATKNIKLIAEKVERGEGTLGRLVNDDKTLEELQGAIADIRQAISPINQMQINVDYHGEFRKDDTSQHYFNLLMQTRPSSYYLLGFTDGDEVIDRTTAPATPEDSPPGSTREIETIERKKAIRFNLQFGKRWYWAGLRFGLFESTGGIASDFYFFSDRLRFTMEAFDFAEKDSDVRRFAHLKAYSSFTFFNHLYLLGGLDDITRLDPVTGKVDESKNYFFGAGISFNDQDLKAMVGAAGLAL
jgi:phospholipid/cholesterol/gamma-HCH transport system substrate-binding protein